MKRATTLPALVFALVLGPPAAAGELAELWQAALAHNPHYAAGRAAADAAAAKRREAAALHTPQLLLGGDARYQTSEQRTAGARFSAPGLGSTGDVAFDTRHADALGLGWSLRLEHRLYDADRDAAARGLTTEAELGGVALAAARQALMLALAQAYFDLLAADDAVAALLTTERATREALDRARARYEAGDAPVLDANEAEARLDLVAAELHVARNALAVRRSRLADLTGRAEFRLARPQQAADDPIADEAAFADWQRRAAERQPEVQLRGLQLALAGHEVARLRAAVAPTVDVYARVGGDRISGDGYGGGAETETADRRVGVTLNVPLWTGGRRDARSRQAVSLKQQAAAELQAAQQDAALERALRSAEVRLDASRTGHAVGDRPLIDVLDAEQALATVRRELAAARYATHTALLALYAGAGALDDTRLREVDASLR